MSAGQERTGSGNETKSKVMKDGGERTERTAEGGIFSRCGDCGRIKGRGPARCAELFTGPRWPDGPDRPDGPGSDAALLIAVSSVAPLIQREMANGVFCSVLHVYGDSSQ